VTLTLKVGKWLFGMTQRLIFVNIVLSAFKKSIHGTGFDIYPQIDNVDIKSQGVTLTLEVGVRLLRMTHNLIISITCAKLLQIPLINDIEIKWTRKCG
jgi:hypothetical protein